MRLRGVAKTVAGLLGISALGATLPAMMHFAAATPEMTVEVTSAAPFSIGEAPIRVAPAELLPDLDRRGTVEGIGPGIWLRSWRATYGHQWEKEVSWPTVVGPLMSPSESVCGYALRVGAAVLDPARGAPGLRAMVERNLRDEWPEVADSVRREGLTLPPLAGVRLELRADVGRLVVGVGVDMTDGAALEIRANVRLGVDGGALTVAFEDVSARPNERLVALGRQAALGSFFGGLVNGATLGVFSRQLGDVGEERLRSGAQEKVQEQAGKIGRQITAELLALRDIASPIPGRSRDRIIVDLPTAPEISPQGITMWPCISISLAGGAPQSLPGIPRLAGGRPPLGSSSTDEIALAISANAMNQALFVTWAGGLLGTLGSTVFSDGPRNQLLEKLAFDVAGIEPLLPPWMAGTGNNNSRLSLQALDLRVGQWDGPSGRRDVVAHLSLEAGLSVRADVVKITGVVNDIRANCMRRIATDALQLSPCLGDLVPLAAIELAGQEKEISLDAGSWFSQLRRKSLRGVHVEVRELDAVVDGPAIRARARVRLVEGPSL